jgi:hypothetical protein
VTRPVFLDVNSLAQSLAGAFHAYTLLLPGEKGYHVRERRRSARATGFS